MDSRPIDTPWLTLDQFMARNHLTCKVHVLFMARAGRIPGAKKIAKKWRFHREKSDAWDEKG